MTSTKPSKAQRPHILMGDFQRLYKERYNKPLVLNKYKYKWAFADLDETLGFAEAAALIEYYFTLDVVKGHSPAHFLNNYDRILLIKAEREAERARTALLLKQTKELVESES